MKTEVIRLRVATSQKQAILEASKNSESMSAWILEKIFKDTTTPVEIRAEESTDETSKRKRCMAAFCKSYETTSKLVHGSTVWLCSTHYDKG